MSVMMNPASCSGPVRPLSPITNTFPLLFWVLRKLAVAIADVKIRRGSICSPMLFSRYDRSFCVYCGLFVRTRNSVTPFLQQPDERIGPRHQGLAPHEHAVHVDEIVFFLRGHGASMILRTNRP